MQTTETITYKGHKIVKRVTTFSRPVQTITEYVVLGKDFSSLAAAKTAVRKYEAQAARA